MHRMHKATSTYSVKSDPDVALIWQSERELDKHVAWRQAGRLLHRQEDIWIMILLGELVQKVFGMDDLIVL